MCKCTYPGGFEWNDGGKNWIKAASRLSQRGHSIHTAGLSLLFVVKDVLHVFTVIRKCTFVLFRSGQLGCHKTH